MWILNDPFAGGTHLPDITLIAPVFERGGELIGFAASRAHHADVGGPTPGGMPARSRRLDEEGVVIPPTAVERGTLEGLAERMRNPSQRLADLRAQRAANALGAERLTAMAAELGARRPARGHGRRPRLRRAPHPRGARPPRRRHRRGGRPARAAGGRGRHRAPGRRARRWRGARARLLRLQPAGTRQPQLPAAGDALRGPVRRPGAARSRRARLRGRPPAGSDQDRAGQRPRRAAPAPPSPRATSRPRVASPTWSSRRSPHSSTRPPRGRGR